MSTRTVGRRLARTDQDERGFVIVLFALLLVVIMLMVGMVLEFGQVRDDRQSNKSSADFAVLAGLSQLQGAGTDGFVRPWVGVCEAIEWLEANNDRFQGMTPEYMNGLGTSPGITNPCADTDAAAAFRSTNVCLPVADNTDRRASFAWFRGTSSDDQLQVEIKSGYEMPDDSFSYEDTTLLEDEDTGEPTQRGCDNFAIIVGQARDRGFSSVAGSGDVSSRIRTVGRLNIGPEIKKVAALLLLERSGCAGLQVSGQGGVVVQKSAVDNPGIIQADSAGLTTGGNCTTNNNPGGWVVYGTPLPTATDPNNGPSIVAEDAGTPSDPLPGRIQIFALQVGGRGGAEFPGGLSHAPSAGGIVSRQPADDRYNDPDLQQITNLHADGYLAASSGPPATPPADYIVVNDCSLSGTVGDASTSTIFVNCAEFTPDNATLIAPTVIFSGKINVANNKTLNLPDPQNVYIRGCISSCSGGGNFSISVAGTLNVNRGTGNQPCPARARTFDSGGAPTGSPTNTTVMATFSGPFLVPGQATLCQTTVYVGRNQTDYSRQTQENGAPNCDPDLPCPTNNAGSGYVRIQGGITWSAPNQSDEPADVDNPFEDLALWAESHESSEIKGQGSNATEGVFFTPNSSTTFAGQASQVQPLNAQFWARRLNLSGLGILNLRPNPKDSISTDQIQGFSLVR